MIEARHFIPVAVALHIGCGSTLEVDPAAPPTDVEHADARPAAPEAPAPQAQSFREEWVHLPVQVFFDRGDATLDDEDEAILREAAAILSTREDIVRIRVEGQTDDDEGTEEEQENLSRQRAEAAAGLMVELGMDGEIVETIGYGSARPSLGWSPPDPIDYKRVEFSILVRRPVP